MSYILEALADSEQARQQIVAAPKYSLLPVVGEQLPQQRRWPFALAGALLVNAAVLHVWLRPSLPGSVASINAPTVPQVAEIPASAPGPGIAPLARSEEPAADGAGITRPEAGPQRAHPESVNERRVTRPPGPADAVRRTASAGPANDSALIRVPLAPKLTMKRTAEAGVATGANPAPIPASPTPAGGTAELPTALQQQLPTLAVAGFIRDEGSGSMVIVNDRLVREGDEVAPDVRLEKILNDGLVFNYKGYRFKR